MSARRSGPFSAGAALAMVVGGAVLFVALLWMIGAGLDQRDPNDGGEHAGGRGLNGYAALAGFMEKRGYRVEKVQSVPALHKPGLLVLTPPHFADGKEIERIVATHRYVGPTIVILPKWFTARVPPTAPGAKMGWVLLGQAAEPSWKGFQDDVGVELKPAGGSTWEGMGMEGVLPDPRQSLSGSGDYLIPLIEDADHRVLAAYIYDYGDYPTLRSFALHEAPVAEEKELDDGLYPLILVFEPDLLNNYGFARVENARLAEELITAATDGAEERIAFDLTLNGFSRSPNLLTLAFTPPFLAATLCLLLAALAVGWRAFNRFGPPRLAGRAIAFGKRALVANAAALVRRTRRFHLLGAPYADAARERLMRALGLPLGADPASTEAAIDRALATRAPGSQPFSHAAAAMRAARRPIDLLRAAQALHALERILKR